MNEPDLGPLTILSPVVSGPEQGGSRREAAARLPPSQLSIHPCHCEPPALQRTLRACQTGFIPLAGSATPFLAKSSKTAASTAPPIPKPGRVRCMPGTTIFMVIMDAQWVG
jgi:hypothetical protein